MPKLALAIALYAFVPALGLAGAPGANPAADSTPAASAYPLPAQERFVYARTIGDKRDSVEISTRLVEKEGAEYCELIIRSPDQDALYKLDPATLFAIYSDITTRSPDETIRRVMTVVENRRKPKADELLVSGAESLAQTLRLFPWGVRQKAKLVFVGSGGGGNFSFELSVSGKETIAVGGRPVECWKAQLGLNGIWGGLMGKTSMWYSTGRPSYLVKSEGPSAGPGSPMSVLLLENYSAE